jgi:Novel STAND NTPase 1/Protein of unknown function (DUF1566)
MKSPFKFLDAYDRQDKEIFFGRAEEIEQLYTLVFQTKLLLVYGQSGTGKTSLIQCGLANRFKPTDWFELFVRRKDNINASLNREIRRRVETPIAEDATVAEAIQSLYLDHLRPMYLIFDQFEELFILGSQDEQRQFIRAIDRLLKSEVACKIIFVMREEYLAALYNFEKAVPTLFNKRFRIEPMNQQNVQQVITGTTAAFYIELEQGEATAQQIIDNLSDHRAGVQLSYLQVYLDKLYREAANERNGLSAADKPIVFTGALVQKTGVLGDVMADFLEEQTTVIQKDLKAKFPATPAEAVQLILEEFVTLEGTKQPMSRAALAAKLTIPAAIVDACLVMLENSRILRNIEGSYELAHDTLAGSVAEKRSAERKRLLKVQKLITDRYSAYEETRTLLSKEELKYIAPYRSNLRLSPEAAEFVRLSTAAAKRKTRILLATGLTVLAVFIGWMSWELFLHDHFALRKVQSYLEALKKNEISVKIYQERLGETEALLRNPRRLAPFRAVLVDLIEKEYYRKVANTDVDFSPAFYDSTKQWLDLSKVENKWDPRIQALLQNLERRHDLISAITLKAPVNGHVLIGDTPDRVVRLKVVIEKDNTLPAAALFLNGNAMAPEQIKGNNYWTAIARFATASKQMDIQVTVKVDTLAVSRKFACSIQKLRRSKQDPFLTIPDVVHKLDDYDFYSGNFNPDGVGYTDHFLLDDNRFFQLNNATTMIDSATGLLWQKSGSNVALKIDDATKYVQQLNNERYGGFTDWRLPTLEEAMSLTEHEPKNGMYINRGFDRKQGQIWTIDSYGPGSWLVEFSTGRSNQGLTSRGDSFYVRAVR